MSFSEDLGSHQDIDFLRVNLPAHLPPRVLAAGAVAIDAQDPCAGECAGERGFDTLRTLTQRQQIVVAATRTCRRDSFLVTAMVAVEAVA